MLRLHTKFRGKQEWSDLGIEFTTGSDEALRLYDSVLTQYVGWYEEEEGFNATIEALEKADKDFFLGRAFPIFMELIATGSSPRTDTLLGERVDEVIRLARKNTLNQRELNYAESLRLLADGRMLEACDVWERILIEKPLDLLALKMAHDCYFYMGIQNVMRDSIARVISCWTPDLPHYGFLLGMWAFGLCETGDYEKAEKKAREALAINRSDSWATHALAHVFEMTGLHDKGIEFMQQTMDDWKHCSMLACHNFWHFAVYNIENDNVKEALRIVDDELVERSNASNAMLDIVDSCSILQRLEMNGVDVGDRWSKIFTTVSQHRRDHVMLFNDAHIIMCLLGHSAEKETAEMLESLQTYVGDDSLSSQSNHLVSRTIGMPLLNGLVSYRKGEYAKAVQFLLPIRYKIITMGGSNAQRDVFCQLLICASLQSPEHNKLTRCLLHERKHLRNQSPLTDRLIARFERRSSSSMPAIVP